jgi:hypothetical protein
VNAGTALLRRVGEPDIWIATRISTIVPDVVSLARAPRANRKLPRRPRARRLAATAACVRYHRAHAFGDRF